MENSERNIYIDANGLILGRLGTFVATKLLQGFNVHLANAEKIVISGERLSLIRQEKERRNIKNLASPLRGPFHWMRPDQFVKRSFRGMLPWKKPRGKTAYRKLKAYLGTPDIFEGKELTQVEKSHSSQLRKKFVTVGVICESNGWKRMSLD